MEMKSLEVLIPIWTANIPPARENENDYLLKVAGTEKSYFFIAIQWCTTEKNYFVQPVKILETGELRTIEVHFSKQAILQFRVQMIQLGIKRDRGFIDVSQHKNWLEQLADIHPALVPQNIK